ncbi:MAG: dTMP kinase [Rhodothermales bacterium]
MFVSFEGIDGSGKSTQIGLLTARIKAEGLGVRVFREPGGSGLSEKIRSLLLDPAYDIHPFAELLLFSAARAELVSKEIKPCLEAGEVVICDRFFDSTIAYQGAGRKLEDESWLMDFQQRVTGGLKPARTYLLQVSIETSVARRLERANGASADRMEKGGSAFFERVIAGYENIAREEPERIVVLDGALSEDVLHQEIWADFKNTWENSVGTRV